MCIFKSKNLLCFGLIAVIISALFLFISCSDSENDNFDAEDISEETTTEESAEEETEAETEPEIYEIVQYERLIERDVTYKTVTDTNGEANLRLDIYYPTNKIYHKNPTIVAFHGGSWVVGTRSDIIYAYNPLFDRLRANGYAVAAVQYRYVSDIIYFPANLEDCIDAILYLAENTDEYDVDPDAIGVVGFSAGAHLAMLSAYAMKNFSSSEPLVNLNYCVSFAGPGKMYDDETSNYPRSILYMLNALFNGSYEEKPELYKLGSPYYYLNGDIKTPLMLIHGGNDEVVPYSQSAMMYEKAAEMNIPCELVTIDNGTHMINLNFEMGSPSTTDLINLIEQFIYRNTDKE